MFPNISSIGGILTGIEKFDKELNNLYNQAWDFKGFMLPPESEGENPFENGYPLQHFVIFCDAKSNNKTIIKIIIRK